MKKIAVLFLGCVLFSAIAFISCNKNSLQLPVPDKPRTFTKYCKLDGVEKVAIVFRQDNNDLDGNTSLEIKNLTGSPISDLKLCISTCEELPANYDNCTKQVLLFIDTLFSNKSYTKQLTYLLPSLTIHENATDAGIISYKGAEHIYSNIYSSIYAEYFINKVRVKHGLVNGYVLADGTALFRLKKDKEYYNITGTIPDSSLFINGYLNDATVVELDSLDGNKQFYYNQGNLKFKLQLKSNISTTDSISSIIINLKKD